MTMVTPWAWKRLGRNMLCVAIAIAMIIGIVTSVAVISVIFGHKMLVRLILLEYGLILLCLVAGVIDAKRRAQRDLDHG